METNNRSPTATVFATPELLEAILLELPMRSLLTCQRVDRTFQATIKGSTKLQVNLYYRLAPQTTTSPIITDFNLEKQNANPIPSFLTFRNLTNASTDGSTLLLAPHRGRNIIRLYISGPTRSAAEDGKLRRWGKALDMYRWQTPSENMSAYFEFRDTCVSRVRGWDGWRTFAEPLTLGQMVETVWSVGDEKPWT